VKTTEIVAARSPECQSSFVRRNAERPSFGIRLTDQRHQEETHPFRGGSRENCRCTTEALGQAEEFGLATHAIFRETICSGLFATKVLHSFRN
jgi:hypothetical protein